MLRMCIIKFSKFLHASIFDLNISMFCLPSQNISIYTTMLIFLSGESSYSISTWDKKHVGYLILKRGQIRWNLSIADMLHSGYTSVADIVVKNDWNHGHSLIEKSLYSEKV